jgi:hypothetical protein
MTEQARFAQAAHDAVEELAARRDLLLLDPAACAETIQRALILLGSMVLWLRTTDLSDPRGTLH